MTLLHKPQPQIIKPFSPADLIDIKQHVKEVRRLFDWPGIDYHDVNEEPEKKFNRWFWHNLPLLVAYHNSRHFIDQVSELLGVEVKPSYCFLSMYGKEGVCPPHSDRPQCQFTVDLCINQDQPWPIYVEENPYVLQEGEALLYSGTGQPHFRKPMSEDSGTEENRGSYIDLAFFHFVPADWQGALR